MIAYPAIDLKDGACVRLLRGDMAAATRYNDDPANQARVFEDAGFRWIHVVDLDGAVGGAPRNAEAVRSILEATSLPVQLGGGIRDMAAVDRWLEAGASRVVLGTVALRDPATAREAARRHPGRVVAALDTRDGRVAAEGWTSEGEATAGEAAMRLEGVAAILHTDIGRDGALEGPNLEASLELARVAPAPVIVSGGVASMDDLRRVRAAEGRLEGVVIGRALYDGRVGLAEAARMFGDA